MKRALLVSVLVAFCLSGVARADAVGNGFHWPRPTTAPAQVVVVDNLPADWHSYVLQAAADYSQAANVDVTVIGPQQCQTSAALADPNTLPSRSTWLPGLLGTNIVCLDSHDLAVLGRFAGYTFWEEKNWDPLNGTELDGVEIYLDDGTLGWSASRKQWLVCHEMGHSMGLAHRPSGDNSCMVDGSGIQHPDSGDLAVIDAQTTVHVASASKPCKGRRCK